ncbi:hypothetical protein D1AOALGA4SA_1962 [Olavius algarvensis Delta 1 endosymbiont]|nr:hypothetical protein D1AOALGA4SA_1962 [Olavius algarvensis Delta 1 endosymbiont]
MKLKIMREHLAAPPVRCTAIQRIIEQFYLDTLRFFRDIISFIIN